MTFGDYPMDKLLFVLTAAWIGISIPTKHFWTGSAKNAANFMYGAPGCVDELASSVKIDMIDGHEPLDVGFGSAKFSNPYFFDGFKGEFASADCSTDVNLATCTVDGPFGDRSASRDHRYTTTFRPNVKTTTTTTTDSDDAKIDSKVVDLVINTDETRPVSPYLKDDKETKCDEILARVRHEGVNYDPFDDSELSKVLFCSAIYGWPLGEHCASFGDNMDLAEDTFDAAIDFSQSELENMRKTCVNATRATCADKFVADATGTGLSRLSTSDGNKNERPLVFDESVLGNVGANKDQVKAAVIQNPCVMVTGFNKHPTGKVTDLGAFKGQRTVPRAESNYFNSRENLDAIDTSVNPHFYGVDPSLLPLSTKKYIITSITADPIGPLGLYESSQGEWSVKSPSTLESADWARVHVPLGETDLKYIAERMIEDTLVLAQAAEAIGREDDFWNKIDQHCFSDGVNGSTDVLIVVSATCIIFAFLGTFLRGFVGQQGCFNMDSKLAESALNFNNYVLAIIGGVAGFLASWDLGGFAAQSGDFHTDRVPRLSFAYLDGLTVIQPDGAAELAAAIDDGQFHSFVELTPSDAALIHALTAFSLLIIVAGAFVTVVETKTGPKGSVGWVQLDGSKA